MTVEAAVFDLLSNDAGVSGVVSNRIYPVKLPQDPTYPAVTYFRVSALRHSAMGKDTGLVEKRIQISSWAKLYSEVNDLADRVRDAMQRTRGVFSGVEILDIFMDGDGPEIWEDEVNVYQAITDCNVIYRERNTLYLVSSGVLSGASLTRGSPATYWEAA